MAVDAPWVGVVCAIGAAEPRDGLSVSCHDMSLLWVPPGPSLGGGNGDSPVAGASGCRGCGCAGAGGGEGCARVAVGC